MAPDLRKYFAKTFQVAVTVATVVVVLRVANQHKSELGDIEVSWNVKWLIAAGVGTTIANLLLPLGWKQILFSLGESIRTRRAVRIWTLAQTARYIPTGIFAVVSRVQLAAREGIARSSTLFSVAVETLILVGWALFLCAVYLPSEALHWALKVLLSSTLLIALLTLPWTFSKAAKGLQRLLARDIPALSTGYLIQGIGTLGASIFVRAVGTVCLAAGILDITSADIGVIIGATYVGVVAGMIGITPAGLGVREGVTTALLVSHFGLADAATFALFGRAWEFAFEILFLAIASWWGRQRSASG
jgi:uncharacterized membrane protein YbhN (UPF0104 family)